MCRRMESRRSTQTVRSHSPAYNEWDGSLFLQVLKTQLMVGFLAQLSCLLSVAGSGFSGHRGWYGSWHVCVRKHDGFF